MGLLGTTTGRRQPAMLGRQNGETQQRRHRPDYVLVILSAILLAIGLIVIYSISPGLGAQKHVSDNYYTGKQIISILLGVGAFVITAAVPLNTWHHLEKPLIIAAGAAAFAVRFFGERVNGAYRWIQIGGLSFQAVELIKFALLIWLAFFLAERVRSGRMDSFSETFKPLIIAFLAIGFVVAGLQSDLGSTGVIVIMMATMCFIAGLPLKRVVMIGGVIVIGVIMAVSISPYRRDRLLTFLHPEQDCLNVGYQACQALIAVGSGGMFGKGLAHSVQAYGYLPEAANDSIFAIYAEKFGFLGVTLLICLFMVFFTRLKNIMERAPTIQTRLLMAGILAWLSTQALINIGAMTGLLPLKGITLPFISYGGTSIIFVTAIIGLAFNISRYTTYTVGFGDREGRSNEDSAYRGRNRRPHYAAVSRRP